MKLEEIILVIEEDNEKGRKYFVNLEDYVEILTGIYSERNWELPYAVAGLYETKDTIEEWHTVGNIGSTIYHARFCSSEIQLRGFLYERHYVHETEEIIPFSTEKCSKECLEVLHLHEVRVEGNPRNGSIRYREQEHTFQEGETIRNMNGIDYRILKVFEGNNLLLMSQSNSEYCMGVGSKYYAKTYENNKTMDDNVTYSVMWKHGEYFGNDITNINFEVLEVKYGPPCKIETLKEYHDSLVVTFQYYQNIIRNKLLSEEVKEAATNSMYVTFATGITDTFLVYLDEGRYDEGFYKQKKDSKEKEEKRKR